MRRIIVACALVASTASASTTETVGDVLQLGVPLAALAVSWSKDDSEGMYQLGKGVLITGFATHTLKHTTGVLRPNGSNCLSFPSGHTSLAFSGASYLGHRYGYEYGLPAYLAASYVGYSRVKRNKHWETDVLAGAALAFTVSYFVTTQYQGDNLTVVPANFGCSDAQGVLFNYSF